MQVLGVQPQAPIVQGYAEPSAPPVTFDPSLEKGGLLAPAQVAPVATQQPALHTVVVPPNAIPGTLTNFQIPDGSVIAVQLPPNAVPGSSITISA